MGSTLFLTETRLEEISQRAFRKVMGRRDVEVPKDFQWTWNPFYLGFESGFLRRHDRTLDPGFSGVINEEKITYLYGFHLGETEREQSAWLYRQLYNL